MSPLAHGAVDARGVRLHYAAAGRGPAVLLLHGFPEFWYSWRRQLPALADAGFHAVALDLRGYNESDKPRGVRAYRTARLVEDVAAVIEQLGGAAHVVGHDWGGILAWRLAALRPELVRRLVIMNAPHPRRFRRELARRPAQWLRSSYALFFQLPWLPERLLAAGDFALVERSFRRLPVSAAAFSDDDIQKYKQALSRPRALTAPLNYYRAALRYGRDLYAPPQQVTADCLIIWGQQDPFLSPRLAQGLEPWAPRSRVALIPEASHWVQNEAPQQVNSLLLDFLAR
jgi:epoxide hydrolase 4